MSLHFKAGTAAIIAAAYNGGYGVEYIAITEAFTLRLGPLQSQQLLIKEDGY